MLPHLRQAKPSPRAELFRALVDERTTAEVKAAKAGVGGQGSVAREEPTAERRIADLRGVLENHLQNGTPALIYQTAKKLGHMGIDRIDRTNRMEEKNPENPVHPVEKPSQGLAARGCGQCSFCRSHHAWGCPRAARSIGTYEAVIEAQNFALE